MNAEDQNRLNALGQASDAFGAELDRRPPQVGMVWSDLVGTIRTRYVMDELWDGKEELKFRRGGKTLVTLYLRPDRVSAMVIFGKAERAKFEELAETFSAQTRAVYDGSRTYHDGKWMMFELTDGGNASEVLRMLALKKKPNRKPAAEPVLRSACGHRCDDCWLYDKNNETQDRRFEASFGLAKCYGGNEEGVADDYTGTSCGGCGSGIGLMAGCAIQACAKRQGSCAVCTDAACPNQAAWGVHPGRCTPGLTAEEIARFVLPYVNPAKLSLEVSND